MTVLLIMLCVLVYVAFENPHENSEYNAKRLGYYIVKSFILESDHKVFSCCSGLAT